VKISIGSFLVEAPEKTKIQSLLEVTGLIKAGTWDIAQAKAYKEKGIFISFSKRLSSSSIKMKEVV
jgi:hypothetical protein